MTARAREGLIVNAKEGLDEVGVSQVASTVTALLLLLELELISKEART